MGDGYINGIIHSIYRSTGKDGYTSGEILIKYFHPNEDGEGNLVYESDETIEFALSVEPYHEFDELVPVENPSLVDINNKAEIQKALEALLERAQSSDS